MCPCKNCNDRAIGCHIACEKYREWKDERNEVNKDIRVKKFNDNNIYHKIR